MQKDLLRVEEAAALLGISTRKLAYLLARGELASVKVGGGRRVSRAALFAFAALPPRGWTRKSEKTELTTERNPN